MSCFVDDEVNQGKIRATEGTAAFFAPEMLTGDMFHPFGCDIWAAGCTLYQIINGSPPFVAQNQDALNVRHCLAGGQFLLS